MSNLSQSFEALFGKLENLVTTKTVVGDAITVGDAIILPLVDVSFGVGAGAGEQAAEAGKTGGGGGGGGAGAKITPSAVVVITKGNAQLVNVKNQDSLSKLIDLAPGVINKISSMLGKGGEKAEETPEKEKEKGKEKEKSVIIVENDVM